MKLHKIADLYVGIDYKYPTMTKQAEPYLSHDKPEIVDIVTWASDDGIKNFLEKYNVFSENDAEYLLTGNGFYSELLHFDGLMIHASAVVYKGGAYLFSADSGTGKSTHTQLWLKAFGNEAKILNDDKPAVRVVDGKAYAYGTPWSGKTDWNLNVRADLKGICFLERAKENTIKRVSPGEVVSDLLRQTIRPSETENMDSLLENMDKLLSIVPVYKMGCNMDTEAALVSYNAMK